VSRLHTPRRCASAGAVTLGIVLSTVLAVCGWVPLVARAQTNASSLPRVIIVSNGSEDGHRPYHERFVQAMREAGQIDGVTFRLEVLHANRDPTKTPALIRQAVAERPSVLVVYGLASARVAHDATTVVPVVVATSSDLVDAGVVKSFAHPGGNITGINDLSDELAAKRLELLKQALPGASRVVLLLNPNFPATPKIAQRVGTTALAIGIELIRVDAQDPASLDAALNSIARSRPTQSSWGATHYSSCGPRSWSRARTQCASRSSTTGRVPRRWARSSAIRRTSCTTSSARPITPIAS